MSYEFKKKLNYFSILWNPDQFIGGKIWFID